jgi:hypothetical protein
MVPAVENVTPADPPGAIVPVSNPPPAFAVAVCGSVSLFVQVTRVPTATVNGFAPNALLPAETEPAAIPTLDAPPLGGGFGVVGVVGCVGCVGDDGLSLPPQAVQVKNAAKRAIRK